ncbi:peptidase C14, caspase domain-containing protein [Mycena sanguinolenta]|nr:peptidase C14, caspase domain-containing protein [Mycena sanguinolenta]
MQQAKLTKKKALLVGIGYNDSKTQDKLDTPHEDVARLREFLIKQYGYSKENITVLLDKPGELQPTQNNIRQQASKLVKGASPGDHFFFFYAGHSVQVPENCRPEDRTELDGLDEVMVPSDGRTASHEMTRQSCLVDNELKRLLINPLPAEVSFTAVLDTCHSASLLDLDHDQCNAKWSCLDTVQLKTLVSLHKGGRSPASPQLRQTNKNMRSPPSRKQEVDHNACARHPASERKIPGAFHLPRCESPVLDRCHLPLVISLSACKDDQVAIENPDDKNGRSFTERLLNILRADPHPRLRDLMKQISISIHGMLLDAGTLEQLNKLQAREDHVKQNVSEVRCQDPQMSSNNELDMESHLETL